MIHTYCNTELNTTNFIINKIMEKRKVKTTNFKQYRRLNNQLRRETDRDKEVYMEEIKDLLGKEIYDLMYQKAQRLGGRTPKIIQIFVIEDNQGNIVTDH